MIGSLGTFGKIIDELWMEHYGEMAMGIWENQVNGGGRSGRKSLLN